MRWLKKFFWKIKRLLDMKNSNEFYEQIEYLRTLLAASGKNQPSLAELQSLQKWYSFGVTAFEMCGLLWELRFDAFYREVLTLCPNGNTEEIKLLCKEFFKNGKNSAEAAQEFNARNMPKNKPSPENSKNNDTSTDCDLG